MTLKFYYTNKRINALTRPDVDESQTVLTTFTDFYLKDETSLNHPTFVIVAGNLPETNYCILSDTGATSERPDKYYYFVNEIVQVRKTVWHIQCTIDSLATWKTYITTQSAFVERSYNQYQPYVTDSILPTKNEITQRTVYAKINSDMQASTTGGVYILSVGSTGASPTGLGVPTYAMTANNCRAFLETLFTPGVAGQAKQYFSTVADAILGLHWLPIGLFAFGGTQVNEIYVAGVGVNVTAVRINNNIYDTGNIFTESCNLTRYGDFRDNAPFRNYYVKLPYGGIVDLDTDIIAEQNRAGNGTVNFNIRQMLDFHTGAIQYTILCNNYMVGRVEGCAKVEMPISTYKANTTAFIGGAVNKYGETVDKVASFILEKITGDPGKSGWDAENPIKQATDTVSKGGAYSIIGGFNGTNIGAYDPEMRIFEKVQNTSVDPSNVASQYGRPYYGVLSLGSLTGYCKTSNFHVRGKMTSFEKQQIENAFNGTGVYMTE